MSQSKNEKNPKYDRTYPLVRLVFKRAKVFIIQSNNSACVLGFSSLCSFCASRCFIFLNHEHVNLCFSGCEPELFDSTLQLREHCLDLKELLVEEIKIAEALKRKNEALIKKVKM